MVVQLIKYCFFMLLLLCSLVQANDDNIDSAGVADHVKLLARERLARSMIAVDAAVKQCKEREKLLPRNTFDEIAISEDEVRNVISYFYFKTHNDCIRSSAYAFMEAVYLMEEGGIFSHDLKEKGEGMSSFSYISSFVMETFWTELEHQARYLSLSEKLRVEIESMNVLSEPFSLIESADNLGVLR
ncbi:MAG: hypothetical protein WD609_01065 [Aquisalimonadaceae bacterium]